MARANTASFESGAGLSKEKLPGDFAELCRASDREVFFVASLVRSEILFRLQDARKRKRLAVFVTVSANPKVDFVGVGVFCVQLLGEEDLSLTGKRMVSARAENQG